MPGSRARRISAMRSGGHPASSDRSPFASYPRMIPATAAALA